jgi:hypothetical protein
LKEETGNEVTMKREKNQENNLVVDLLTEVQM